MGVIIFMLDQIAFAEPGGFADGFAFAGEFRQRVDYSTFTTVAVIEGVVALLAFLLVIGASFKAVSDLYIGNDTNSGDSIRYAAGRVHSMLWIGFLFTLGVGLAIFALVLPAIWLFVAWSLAIPALLSEGLKGSKALGRSFDLIRHNWWRTFGAILVGIIFIGLFQFLLELGASGLSTLTEDSLQGSLLIYDAAQVLTLIITGPLEAAIIAVIYYDLRVRKEAFDVHILTQQLESPGSTPPAAGAPPQAPSETPPPPSTPSGW
jgi:hypothetical protein